MELFCPCIEDFKSVFKYKIRREIYMYEIGLLTFLWIFNEFSEILKEEIDNLIVKSFAGCYSGLILYLKTV